MEANATTWVVLGLLGMRRMSGYEMKQVVDRSTRFFWAASYGQLYPELRRLEGLGLVAGESEPTGARPRRVFALSSEGREALHAWLRGSETRMETRDESLLRLFFADCLPRDEAVQLLRARADHHRASLAELEATAAAADADPPFVSLTLRYGLDYCRWEIDWCEARELELREDT